MTMRMVRPVTITDAILLDSTVAEDPTPAWGVATTYASGARRHLTSTHRVYQSLQDSNLGNHPVSTVGYWADGGPTNRWAMFDTIAETVTSDTAAIVVRLQPGPVSAIALLRLQAYSVRVLMRDAPGGTTVYDRTVSLEAVPVIDWYTWTIAPFRYRQSMVLTDLPVYPMGELEITINPISGLPVQCGVLAVGSFDELGDPQQGTAIRGKDYSLVKTDDYGSTTIVRRSSAKDLDFEIVCTEAAFDTTAYLLDEARGIPHVWVPTLRQSMSQLICWGLIETWDGKPKNGLARISGHIKGLI